MSMRNRASKISFPSRKTLKYHPAEKVSINLIESDKISFYKSLTIILNPKIKIIKIDVSRPMNICKSC